MCSMPRGGTTAKRPAGRLVLVSFLGLLLAIVSLAPAVAAAPVAKIKLKDGTIVEGRIEGQVVQKRWSFPEGGGGYVVRDGSSITEIDEHGVHLQKNHKVETISSGRVSFRMTEKSDESLDSSTLLGEIPKSELGAAGSSLEQRVIPTLRVKVKRAEALVPVKDIVDFIQANDTKK